MTTAADIAHCLATHPSLISVCSDGNSNPTYVAADLARAVSDMLNRKSPDSVPSKEAIAEVILFACHEADEMGITHVAAKLAASRVLKLFPGG
jgi:hypothetical protein